MCVCGDDAGRLFLPNASLLAVRAMFPGRVREKGVYLRKERGDGGSEQKNGYDFS